MKWAFQIEHTSLDPRNLSDLLSGIGFNPADTPGLDCVFCSPCLENCKSASEVWEEAINIRYLLRDVTEIDPELVLGPVIDLSSGSPRKHHFLEVRSGLSVTANLDVILTVSPPENLSDEELAEYHRQGAEQEYQAKLEQQKAKLYAAFREPRASKLLNLLKLNAHTGETLYKMYELAEGHPSQRKKFQAELGISEVDFRRFSDAVHNPVVSGDLARHAYEDKPKTDNPMTIGEARTFVMDIARRWLMSLRV